MNSSSDSLSSSEFGLSKIQDKRFTDDSLPLEYLPKDHRQMSEIIKKLPDCEFHPQNHHQEKELDWQRSFWNKVGRRIDYLQSIQFGLCPALSSDPCQNPLLNSVQAEWLDVFSSYHFRILQLLIADPGNSLVTGFSIIREWANFRKREFLFENPRELFSQICRDQANSGWEINIEGNPTKKEIQRALQTKKKLFKGSLREVDRRKILNSWEQEDWSLAWIPSIYGERVKEPLRNYWHKLDASHDRLVAFICRKQIKENIKILFSGRDNAGRPIDRETRRLLEFDEVL